MKISCIVPIYNVEKYIYKCMESIFKQTFEDFEVIAIVDGSKDASESILRKNFEKNKKLRIISRENKGLLATRIEGVQVANGEYIIFVDSDDWIEETMFEKYIENIGNNSIIRSNKYIAVDEKNRKTNYIFSNAILKKDEIIRQFAKTYNFNNVTCQMIKKDIFENLIINENISMGEDLLLNINLYKNVDEIVTIEECLYNYRINYKSISRSMNIEKIDTNIRDIIYVYNRLAQYIKDNKNNLVSYTYARIIKEINNEFSKYFCIRDINKKCIIERLKGIVLCKEIQNAIFETNMKDIIKQNGKKLIFNVLLYKKNIQMYYWLGRILYKN